MPPQDRSSCASAETSLPAGLLVTLWLRGTTRNAEEDLDKDLDIQAISIGGLDRDKDRRSLLNAEEDLDKDLVG